MDVKNGTVPHKNLTTYALTTSSFISINDTTVSIAKVKILFFGIPIIVSTLMDQDTAMSTQHLFQKMTETTSF